MTLPVIEETKHLTEFGSKLFLRCVSGTRVVSGRETNAINGIEFKGWGAHCNNYPTPYLTAAATVGMEESDIEQFLHRLSKLLATSWKEPLVAESSLKVKQEPTNE